MRILALLVTIVTATAAGGCAGTTSPAGRPVDRLAEARAALPDSIRRAGTVVAGTDPTYEPMTFMRGTTYAGLDIDLAEAVVTRLGLRIRWQTVTFGDLLDQVRDHRIDMSISSMFDRSERQQKADFVDYLNAGTSIVVRKGVGDVGGMPGLCGRRVAVQPATVFVDMAGAQRRACGRKGLTVVLSQNPSADVRDRKADAGLNDFPIALVDVEKMPTLEISGPQIEAIPYGIGIAKDRTALTAAVQAALYSLINDGTYDRLLAKWKVDEGALRTGAVDGGA